MSQINITELGNPGNPTGDYGKTMLLDMNNHHYEVTTWGLSHWEVKKSDTVLDIGCGGGRTIQTLSNQTEQTIFGVDYSQTALDCCAEFNKSLIESGRLELTNASVEKLPFNNNNFNKIVTVESFYFWPNPVQNLKEVLRVLKPGGTFLLIADIYGDAKLTDSEIENVQKYNLFNPKRLEFVDLFMQAGFADVSIHTKQDTNWICVEGKK